MRYTRRSWRRSAGPALAGLAVGLGLMAAGCRPTGPVGKATTPPPTEDAASRSGTTSNPGEAAAGGAPAGESSGASDGPTDLARKWTDEFATGPSASGEGWDGAAAAASRGPAPASPAMAGEPRPTASPGVAGGTLLGRPDATPASGGGAFGEGVAGEGRFREASVDRLAGGSAPARSEAESLDVTSRFAREGEAAPATLRGTLAAAEAAPAAAAPAMPAPGRPPAPEAPPADAAKESSFDRRLQSGTLTAGSLDDHRDLDDFATFVAKVQEHDASELMPRFAIGQRHSIVVLDRDNQPVGDAVVEVLTDGDAVRHAATTGTDGRTLFLTGRDGAGAAESYRVRVTIPGDETPRTETFSASQSPWVVRVEDVEAKRPRRLDLALVIDTTGSMGDELEYLKVEIASIAGEVRSMFPDVEQRYALLVYRDVNDAYVTQKFDFTTDLEAFRANLGKQSADGGGDTPEAMDRALAEATELDWSDRETAKVCFLVADAPPHDDRMRATLDTIGTLREKTVRLYPLMGSGSDEKAEFLMRAGAFLTRGKYLFLTDHSGVGGGHADPHAKSFEVERLDRLMVRLIAGELAGRSLQADHVIAIEKGTDPAEFVVSIEPEATAPTSGPSGGEDAAPARDEAGRRGEDRAASTSEAPAPAPGATAPETPAADAPAGGAVSDDAVPPAASAPAAPPTDPTR